MKIGDNDTEKTQVKTRNWNFIVYPESAPEAWEQLITDLQIPWCHSPLHDKDTLPTGELKKPHYHCILLFDGPTTQRNVQSILKEVLCAGAVLPIPCRSIRGSVRYFAHLDNPDKAPYNPNESFFYGCDVGDLVKPTTSEKDKYIREMCEFCDDHGIYEFCDLTDYARINNEDWFHLLHSCCTLFMMTYLRSRKYKLRDTQAAGL